MTKLKVAALQLAFGEDTAANIANVSELVREAASKGARVVLPPELFEGPYFCRVEDEEQFATAKPTADHPSVIAMQALAAELEYLDSDQLLRARRPASLQQPGDGEPRRQGRRRLSQEPHPGRPRL